MEMTFQKISGCWVELHFLVLLSGILDCVSRVSSDGRNKQREPEFLLAACHVHH